MTAPTLPMMDPSPYAPIDPPASTTTPEPQPDPAPPVDRYALAELYRKIAEVFLELGELERDGRHENQGWDYASVEQVLRVAREPLRQRRVLLLPSLVDHPDAVTERPYKTPKSKDSVVTTARMTFTFIDGDSGATHVCHWAGTGDDTGEKGLGKAYSNAIRTFLREAFLLPQAETQPQTRPASSAAPKGPPLVNAEQGRRIIEAAGWRLSALAFLNVLLQVEGTEPVDIDDETARSEVQAAVGRVPAAKLDEVILAVRKAVQDADAEAPQA